VRFLPHGWAWSHTNSPQVARNGSPPFPRLDSLKSADCLYAFANGARLLARVWTGLRDDYVVTPISRRNHYRHPEFTKTDLSLT
jgi:hypothetical protein